MHNAARAGAGMDVVLDTSVLFKGQVLTGLNIQLLREYVTTCNARLLIPAVVREEYFRQVEERIHEAVDVLRRQGATPE